MKISIVGIGKLGVVYLATLASKGFEVIGIDINKEIVDKVNQGEAPIYEPGLAKLLKENKSRITATTNHSVIKDTDMTIILVSTPSLPTGDFSTEYVEAAVLEIGRSIPSDKEYHNVVVSSTVLPKSIMEKIKPVLERASGRKVGDRLGLCYNPEFIAIGNIINGILRPDFVLIGESDKRAGDMVEAMWKQLTEEPIKDRIGDIIPNTSVSSVPIHRMSCYNAELVKIGLNAYLTMKISFANTITEICENMPSGNAEKVLTAIGSDSRVGQKFLKPGLGYGGPCLPRDSRAFLFSANRYNVQAPLSQVTDVINIKQIKRIATKILEILSQIGTNKLSVLGLTYKSDAPLVEESASLKIIQKLLDEGIEICVYDPSFQLSIIYDLPTISGLIFSENLEQCLSDANVCFIGTPWKEFQEITKNDFLKYMRDKPIIIDGWGIQKDLYHDPEIDYYQIGIYKE